MNKSSKGMVSVALVVIVLGGCWLLNVLKVAKAIDWTPPGFWGLLGVLTFYWGGRDKATLLFGPMFLIASVLNLLVQTAAMPGNYEMPVLVVTFGVLLLAVTLSGLPTPEWLKDQRPLASSAAADGDDPSKPPPAAGS